MWENTETALAGSQGLDVGERSDQGTIVGRLIVKSPIKLDVVVCTRHPHYRGLRKPRVGCDICISIYQYNQASGIRETRSPRGTRKEKI